MEGRRPQWRAFEPKHTSAEERLDAHTPAGPDALRNARKRVRRQGRTKAAMEEDNLAGANAHGAHQRPKMTVCARVHLHLRPCAAVSMCKWTAHRCSWEFLEGHRPSHTWALLGQTSTSTCVCREGHICGIAAHAPLRGPGPLLDARVPSRRKRDPSQRFWPLGVKSAYVTLRDDSPEETHGTVRRQCYLNRETNDI